MTFNLKGIIIGNGVTDWKYDGDPSYVEMGYYFGLYGIEFKTELEKHNCTFEYLDVEGIKSPKCRQLYSHFKELISCIYFYDVY